MSANSNIEWTDHTFNPWEGCQKVSPGCDHCYAEARNARFAGGTAINWGPGALRRRTSAANWRKPLQWNANHRAFFADHGRRQRVFCASLADVFDNAVPDGWRSDLLDLIARTPDLDWLLLTKRIGNAEHLLRQLTSTGDREDGLSHVESKSEHWGHCVAHDWLAGMPPNNVWLGATIVNQEEADRDIRKLLSIPARVRFLSMEPLLGPVNLTRLLHGDESDLDALRGQVVYTSQRFAVPPEPLGKAISWVIVGGESGPAARPMHPQWVRSLRNQCAAAQVPFLFKQNGEWVSVSEVAGVGAHHQFEDGSTVRRIGKRAAGRKLDGRSHDEFPEVL
ncbi:phage Gp37/Gp68 family protein [Paraburkholderia dioscoreae]|uniref:Protein gp37 n=1 Tax=Paraburkholderia dioscoreae TaxID=2604047 RepID=A0A5Q4ZD40_9BURK|nr:phage Gp37/Gp68 family protein [Paraburkholderia dioscoreae]VVD28458.1 Protein gp37 [Paraburkholderia dioscoreae]